MKPINHLLFMEDWELFGAKTDQLNSLDQAVRILSETVKDVI